MEGEGGRECKEGEAMVEAMGSFWVDVVEGKVWREGGREGKE